MNRSRFDFAVDRRADWARGEPIAIVGASCRLPGAPSLDALWPMLLAGTDAVSEIPDGRWNKAQFFHPERGVPGKAYTFAAGVLDGDVGRFDPAFFGISPREAAQMDPQQRLLLELAYEAVEDSGLDLQALAGEPVGVFIGGSSWDYLNLNISDPSSTDAYSMIGVTLCSLANRISYAFDLRGPSFTVDTACSSSLVALHQGCEAIRRGQVDMALVGGVSLLLAPQSYVGFCAASMLSPKGRCHAFDARADGYVRAEGGGVVLLKPLGAALAAGDTIRGVIRGTGVNSDGRTTGLSLPNREAQAALLDEVYSGFGLDPERLAYLEAHGTGTPAGDPIEAAALGEMLGQRRSRPLPIGSIKTNIGHLEAGSGMAGLLKAMLVAEHGIVPPSLNSATPNPHIPFDELNLHLAREAIELPADGQPRLVGVNSFGFGGTNAHAVIESPDPCRAEPTEAAGEPLPPLLLSARSEEALRALAADWRDRVAAGAPPALVRGAALHRTQHKRRLSVPAGEPAAVAAALDAFVQGKPTGGVAANTAVAGEVAFIFSGNGSQWAGMAQDAMAGSAAFRAGLQTADAALAPWLGWSVADALATPDEARLRDTAVAQPLLFAVQVALVLALREHGLEPSAAMGHSVGEVAAAWCAGALQLDEAARVIAARSHAQQARHGVGGMAVLGLDAGAAIEALRSPELADAGIEIAAHNSSQAVTVAGDAAALDRLEAQAAHQGWRFTRLDLDYAFHSAAMDPIRDALAVDLAGLAPSRATLPFVSTVTGTVLDGPALDAGYWWRNVREPVLFAEAARLLVAQGTRIFVEIGPHPVVGAYLSDALRAEEQDGRVVPTLGRRRIKDDPIALFAARAHAAGADIRRAEAFNGPALLRDLPRYPWQREHFWVAHTGEETDPAVLPFAHPLLGRQLGAEPLEWERHLGLELMPWLHDHQVGGAAVVPAAALLEAAFAAARERFPDAARLELLDVEIGRALVLEAHQLRDVRFRIGSPAGDFTLSSRPRLTEEPWTVHMSGRIAPAEAGSPVPTPTPVEPSGRRMEATALYALAANMGLDYGPVFRVVDHIDVLTEREAEVRFAALPIDDAFLLPPNLVDGALQGLLALAADRLGSDTGVLPWRFGRARLFNRAGGVPATARLSVTRVGPRSVRADVLLLTADGQVLAELADCWFVRVTLGRKPGLRDQFFHPVLVPAPSRRETAETPDLSGILGPEAAETAATVESRLLVDAFIATAAVEALQSLAGGGGSLPVQSMIRDGVIAAESRPLLDRLLRWLAADGLAEQRADGSWQLQGELPPSDAILRTLFFDLPQGVADVALLAVAAETLPDVLRRGPEAAVAPPGALWEQLLLSSPAGSMAADALVAAIARRAKAAAGDRPLRILEVGARRGHLTRRLARELEHRAVLVAATEAADLPTLRAALESTPAVRPIAWSPGETLAEAPFDLVVGLHLLALQAWSGSGLAALNNCLAPGGTLLLAEPAPNRLWPLVQPLGAPLADERRVATLLDGAGFAETRIQPLDSALWPTRLVAAIASGAAVEPAASGRVVLLAAEGDRFAAAVAQALGARGEQVVRYEPDALASPELADARELTLVLPALDEAALPGWLATLAGLAARGGETPLAINAIVRAEAVGDPVAAALTGVRRVLANEAPHVTLRLVRLDPALADDVAAVHAAEEINRSDREEEVTWALSGRQVARVRRGLPDEAADPTATLRLAVQRPGLLDSLGWEKATPQAPGEGEIGIAVAAAGLNFRDVMWSMGLLPDEALLDGFAGPTLGLECAGTVTAVGPGVSGFGVGDRVMAFAPAALSTHSVTRAHAAMRVPDGMSFAAAATVPVAFVTVAYALGTLAQLAEGETVLVHGGAGGVGLAAIQYARARGARVLATAGSPAKRALLRSLDVEAVLDSRSLSFADEVMALTGGQGVDVVLNSLAGEAMRRSLGLVKPFGRFLELGKRDFYENSSVGLRPFRHNVSYFGIDADQLPVKRPALAAALFRELGEMFAAGTLRPLPYRLFDYADVEDAFRLMQGSGHLGKIVLAPGARLPAALPTPAPFRARADATYLVTGGLDGFGRETARWLARHGARHLALVSRRGPATPGAAETLAEFAQAGVDARAYAADVSDDAALAPVLATIRADQAPLGGVVHAAVAMDDALLTQLDADRFARALAPKLGGAEALDRLTRGDALNLFLLFSSVTTPLGNPGQGNYVAANAAIEAVAERRRAEGLPALAVQWGPIGDAGYLSRETQVSEMLARQLGGSHLSAAEALDQLPALLAAGIPVAGLATVRWAALRNRLPLLGSALFAEMDGDGMEEAGEVDLRALLTDCSPEEARTRVTAMLVDEVARIMKLASDKVEASRPLAELGMDSLMAVELRLAVEQRFGITVPLLALSEGATLSAMAGRIVRGLSGEEDSAPADGQADIAARLAQFEGPAIGPADRLEGPAEPGFAAAAATSP